MTPSVLWTRWRMYLVLVLMCQTAQRVQSHPHAPTKASQDIKSFSTQDVSISKIIEAAYNRKELLRKEEWSRQTDDRLVIRSLDSDISRESEYLNDGIASLGERKLLEATNTDVSTTRTDADEKIVFPDGSDRVSSIPSIPSTTSATAPACYKDAFCENVADYPRQLVSAAIARNASLRFLESIDPMLVEQRIDVSEVPLCQYSDQVVYPQSAQNKEKQWLFIVNQEDLKQGIRIEVCVNEGQECNMIQGFAEGYKTSCKQKYIYRELAAVGNNGNIIKDQFRFPSSCCCHVKFVGDPSARLGADVRSFRQNTTIASKAQWGP
ncbi:Protein spaetzle [Camponotus japonicus]